MFSKAEKVDGDGDEEDDDDGADADRADFSKQGHCHPFYT
jgi:hypothetical protein